MKRKRKRTLLTGDDTVDRPISDLYPVIDTDLARDNIENDQPAAELEDL